MKVFWRFTMPSEIYQCWSCKSVLHDSELMKTEDGKDCPYCCTDNLVNIDELPEDRGDR